MHAHDRVPLLLRGADEHPIAHEAGVVHDRRRGVPNRLDAPRRTRRRPPSQSAIVVAVGDRLAAERDDRGDDLLGRGRRRAGAVERDADVVDDDARPLARELERVRAAEAATGAGHDDDSSLADARLLLRTAAR
jgi:hypothetical protein